MDTANILRQYIDEYFNIWPFSGVICVCKAGEIIFQSATGQACREHGIDNTMETCFSLGSISKQFTAFSILQLYEKGLLDIFAPANQYLPKEYWVDTRITPHHLMSHTAGLNQFYDFDHDFFGIYNRGTYNQFDYFKKYIDQPLRFSPGEKFEYSNAGYNLLAWIVEHISGMPFEAYLKENVFLPLGMAHTALDTGTNIIKNKAYPYQMDMDTPVRCQYYNEKFSAGAGGVVSNCGDLLLWYKCLRERRLLSGETYALFFSENKNAYCYGLNHDKIYDRERYFHGGDHFGVMAYMQSFFQEDTCVIVLANLECGHHYHIGDSISRILFTGIYEKPRRLARVAISEELAQLYEGVYLDGKIELRRYGEDWAFVRCGGELRIAVYPAGTHAFARKWDDQKKPHELEPFGRSIKFFGYEKHVK